MKQWFEGLIDSNTKEEGLDVDKFKEDFYKELTIHLVPKNVFNEKNEELKQAKANSSSDLQQQLDELKARYEGEKINNALKAALADAHSVDVAIQLIGDKVSLNDNGEVQGIEEAVKDLREQHAFMFKVEEADKGEEAAEVKEPVVVVDNSKLTNTKASPLTVDDIFEIEDEDELEEAIEANIHLFK